MSICGGSWTVVAMHYTSTSKLFLVVYGLNLLGRILHDVIAAGSFHTVLIGIVVKHRLLAAEVVKRRRRGNRPLQRSCLPWILRSGLAPEAAVDQVVQENELRRAGDQGGDSDELVYRDQRLHEVVNERLIAAHIAGQAQIVERHEDAVGADEAEPEVDLAQGVVHHPAGHLGEPEVSSGEDAEDGCYRHDQVEVTNHEIGRVQQNVERWLCQKESADATGDKHRDKTEAEQGSRVDAQLRAIQAAYPDQDDDRRRYGNYEGGERERQRGERIHAADEHVMAINHVAEEGQCDHGIDQHAMAQHGAAHIGDEDVGNDAHSRHDSDVHLRMAEKPEQVLPQKSGTTGVRLQLVVDHQVRGNEETGSGNVIED